MAIPRIKIPPQFEDGFKKLLNLSEEAVERYAAALEEIPETFNIDHLVESISERTDDLPKSDRIEMLRVLFSLYGLKIHQGSSADELVDSIFLTLTDEENKRLQIPPDKQERAKEKLRKLLLGKTFEIAAKAMNLLYAQNRALQGASIISDIRTVFGENPEDLPVAAIIIHRLQLNVLQGNEFKDIFVALDDSDIDKLIEVLNRAKKKSASLKALLATTQTRYVGA